MLYIPSDPLFGTLPSADKNTSQLRGEVAYLGWNSGRSTQVDAFDVWT